MRGQHRKGNKYKMKHEFKVGDLVKVVASEVRPAHRQGVVVSKVMSPAIVGGGRALVLHPTGHQRQYRLSDLFLVARGEQNET